MPMPGQPVYDMLPAAIKVNGPQTRIIQEHNWKVYKAPERVKWLATRICLRVPEISQNPDNPVILDVEINLNNYIGEMMIAHMPLSADMQYPVVKDSKGRVLNIDNNAEMLAAIQRNVLKYFGETHSEV